MKNVLIIDSDLGFVFWLGQALDAAGYETLPAKGVSEAVSLLSEFRVIIDLLIVRYGLPGADAFAAELRWAQGGHLKAVALVDESDDRTESLRAWDAWQRKPNLPDEGARRTFLKLVQSVLTSGTVVPSA